MLSTKKAKWLLQRLGSCVARRGGGNVFQFCFWASLSTLTFAIDDIYDLHRFAQLIKARLQRRSGYLQVIYSRQKIGLLGDLAVQLDIEAQVIEGVGIFQRFLIADLTGLK